MKLNSMKFNEISSVVSQQSLKLNLFDHPDPLFQAFTQPAKSHRSPPKFLPPRQLQRPHTRTSRRPSSEDSLFYLQKSLLDYTDCISGEERRSIKRQLQQLLQTVRSQGAGIKLTDMEGVLSKIFKNRLVHLVFYLVWNQVLEGEGSSEVRLIRNYILCEYYSRKFNFRDLSLCICIRLQRIYCRTNSYELSRHYARKALKLAVVLNNDYHETRMVQALHILNYYEGRLNQGQPHALLSPHERKRIIETYDQQTQTPDILGACENWSPGFGLEQSNNFIENGIPNQNIRYFQANYHEIIKTIPGKSINLRGIISKVGSVGVVKKYFGKDNFITIKPQCHVIKETHQEQVLITHKKEKPRGSAGLTKILRRIGNMLEYSVSVYETQ